MDAEITIVDKRLQFLCFQAGPPLGFMNFVFCYLQLWLVVIIDK